MQRPEVPVELIVETRRLMSVDEASSELPTEAKQFARDCDGLLIGWVMSYTALRPNGDVVDWDPPDPPTISSSYSAFLQALGGASGLHPTLAKFIPSRPARASDCHFCNGKGHRATSQHRCPMCGGLGWLPGED
jgi:hypothetical protein